MAINLRGAATGADAEVDLSTKALRATLRPLDYGVGGSFQLTSKSGIMAAGLTAAAPIYAFRNASASLLAVVKRVKISAWSLGTGFTAGLSTFEMVRAISWTVADTGGAVDVITTVNGKLRSNMASIASLAEIRHSDTATLTAGTRTLDSQPLESLNVNVPVTANFAFVPAPTKLFEKMASEFPLVLAASEGFIIRATVPATGTWTFAITPEWDEVASY